ncbi:MAG: pseudaminic acid synthase [Candidatus Nealsonbacteria bacterium RIFOXYC1_FULL_40_7]|uniref:Pseudaminic acid synthase n=1 Tax=Candidatus Nealsonbacteria bacterium RIFOXYC1_FULL_40_7 TaxID=1801678 RepID=A0A1G2EPM2_9BACT|nr:MAG: pseudaminic acid synthase [Candidatus Nealsonbacteria bacterium RIFOXYC1_FULL_40_7]
MKLRIGSNYRPFIIAEMSGNHNQSLERALKIVDAAAAAGAQAVKLQTYTADTLTLDVDSKDFLITDKNSLWSGRKLYDLYQEAHTPWDWHKSIFQYGKKKNIFVFSTPFDETAVDFLESLNAPFYKVASFEINHLPLLRKIALTGKPIVISTGMASISELTEALDTIRNAGRKNQIVLLKCTSAYPASPKDANLRTLPHMRELFDCQVGLSDHSKGLGVALAAIAQGATVIEKHLTLSRSDGGVDSAFSLEPDELKELVVESKRVWQSLGIIRYGATESEVSSVQFRRSMYISQDMKRGDVLKYGKNLRVVRPGYGLPAKFLPQFNGRKVLKTVKAGTRVTWNLLDRNIHI